MKNVTKMFLPILALISSSTVLAQSFDDQSMIDIPAGSFEMGCNHARADELCQENSKPAHQVKLNAFRIDKYEVTFRRYKNCVDAGECTEPFIGGACNWEFPNWNSDHPVNCVDYAQAQNLCKFEGRRLPTEAEWEYAARGNMDKRIFPWGDEPATCEHASMDENGAELPMPGCGLGTTTPVYQGEGKGDSPFGVVGMSGNLWEWTSDWYSDNYYASSPEDNPQGPTANTGFKTVRGGAWTMRLDGGLTSTLRFGYSPQGQGYVIGFRCAADN
ncbi:SUMF1/EgtB/PvdO family nonheme iron enzyme [Maricurvus nonylphenolicus]|uniref:formylglycine-generating enzyme family protein n=1 Tax=Maricurvus nonylphenolicus TaxID=1008307 RepID=UPI0036F1E5B3